MYNNRKGSLDCLSYLGESFIILNLLFFNFLALDIPNKKY